MFAVSGIVAAQPAADARPDIAGMANCLRILCADMVENAGSGHPGMPMGMADVATILFANHLTFDPGHPEWIKRDRFVLSAGHGSALAYALLHLIGSPDMTMEELKALRRRGSLTPGHPEFGHTPGIECTTGPLGQGMAMAVGMAISERKLAAELGPDVAGHRIFVMAGDGCLMEGISHEAAALAGHLRLGNLIVLFDDNEISIDGAISITSSENVRARFESYGWETIAVDGHDLAAVDCALGRARSHDRPTLIACRTQIGRGAPTKAGTAGIHGSPLGTTELQAARQRLGWTHSPFDIPPGIRQDWRRIGERGSTARQNWARVEDAQPDAAKARISGIEQRARHILPSDVVQAIRARAQDMTRPTATRVSSKEILEVLVAQCPWLIGGSADLSGSNGTRVGSHRDFSADVPSGNYMRYGVREHAMAAAMNGIALSGAYMPYGGTFLVFSDYCRPAIRLAALMKLPVVYVFTHDSIGLGEDGPTHQPVEHLASLRLIPGLRVFRPADAVEVAECWELALHSEGPSVLALSRQDLPLLRQDGAANRSAAGAYCLSPAKGRIDVTLIASGSEVHVAVAAKSLLEAGGIGTQVISVPCLEIWEGQARADVDALLSRQSALCVALEAGATLPWRHLVGPDGIVVGIDGFGESASASELFASHGITAEAVAARVMEKLNEQGSPA